MSKQKSNCTLRIRHKWEWIRNFTYTNATYSNKGSSVRISLRGLYKCACGAIKHGSANHNGPDLRQLIDGEV